MKNGWNFIFLFLTAQIVCTFKVAILNQNLNACCKISKTRIGEAGSFGKFGMPDWLMQSCCNLNIASPTLTQERALPIIFNGDDVALQAPTGSGKTLCYLLPLLTKLNLQKANTQGIIVAPTRDLGIQIFDVLDSLINTSTSKISVLVALDGSRKLYHIPKSSPHIVIGNPASLFHLLSSNRLRLKHISFLVVDEVDACLSDPTSRKVN